MFFIYTANCVQVSPYISFPDLLTNVIKAINQIMVYSGNLWTRVQGQVESSLSTNTTVASVGSAIKSTSWPEMSDSHIIIHLFQDAF